MDMAVLTGRSLDDIENMSVIDFYRWQAYMRLKPPNGTEMLLAQLCMMFANAHRGKDQAPAKLYDFAPWLESPSDRQKRLEEEAIEARRAKNQMARYALEMKRKEESERQDGSADI